MPQKSPSVMPLQWSKACLNNQKCVKSSRVLGSVFTWLQACGERLSDACDVWRVSSLAPCESGCDPAHLISVSLREAPELTAHTPTLKTHASNMLNAGQSIKPRSAVWEREKLWLYIYVLSSKLTYNALKLHIQSGVTFPMNQTHDVDITSTFSITNFQMLLYLYN